MIKAAARIHLLIIGLYLVLSLALTYPLVTHFTTHVPGSATWAFDEYTFLWNMWWFKYSIFDLQTNPLYSSFIFYPLGISLVLYTYHLHNALLSVPLQAFLSLTTVNNVLLIGSLTLSGYGTFLLLKYLIAAQRPTLATDLQSVAQHRRDDRPLHSPSSILHPSLSILHSPSCRGMAAFLGGIVYAFTASRFVYLAMGHYNFASNHWIPFYALYAIKTIREPRAKNAFWAGIFLTLTLSCEMTYGIFLAVFTIVYLLFTSRKKIFNIQFVKRLGLLAITFLLSYSPMLYFVFREMLHGGYTMEGWGDALKLSTDLLGFFTPTKLHPFWGGDWVRELRAVVEGTARFSDVNTVFIGYVTLLLAIFALFKYRRALKVWGVVALTSAILCLGPLLQINGQYLFDLDGLLAEAKVTFPMPFALLHYLPIANANRAPNRFSVIMTLSLAVMVGYAAFWILNRVPSKSHVLRFTFYGLLLTTLSFEHLSIPLPLTDARIPEVCYQIGAEPGHFAILQLPMGWRNSFGTLGSECTQAQYYQAAHRKPIISGNISRNPPFKFEYFKRISLFKSITALELYKEVDAATRERDKVLAPELMYLYDVRYLLILPPIPGLLPYADTMTRTVDYALEILPLEPEPVYDRDGVLAYRVIQPPPQADFTIDFGLEETEMYRGEGWSWNEEIGGLNANWATAQRARVFVPLRQEGDYKLTIAALPFSHQGAPPQKVKITMNGHPVSELSLTANWAPYKVDIPSTVIRYGLNELTLHFSHLASPQDVLPGSSDQRTLAVAVDYVKFERVKLNSVSVQPPLRRLRIAPATGRFSVGEDAFALKAAAKPSQGFSVIESVTAK